MIQYDVFVPTRNGEVRIDSVFFSTRQDPAEVRKSLVEHDGYDARIYVREFDPRDVHIDLSPESLFSKRMRGQA